MAMYIGCVRIAQSVKKRTSIGRGLRRRGSFKKRGQKLYRGQGK